MHDIAKIYICFITVVIFFMMINCVALATTVEEDLKLQSELQSICNSYKNSCTINLTSSNDIQGYTTYQGEIILTKGLRNVLNYNEVKAVGLHEIGHHVLKHYKKQEEFFSNPSNWNNSKIRIFRHNNELQADKFATAYLLITRQPNYLPEALIKLTAPDKMDIETGTHPSTNRRIQAIKEYKSKYERL